MSAGHARNFYFVRVDSGTIPGWAPGLYRIERGGKPERVEESSDFFPSQPGQQSYAYTYLFSLPPGTDLPAATDLDALGAAMAAPADQPIADSDIPAGYTYLGQFIFHDLTFLDLSRKHLPPKNLRTPALDLDSVLAVDGNPAVVAASLGLLPVGHTSGDGISIPEDIPRELDGPQIGSPQIVDGRNDTFLPLAQSHLLLIKFYNAVTRWLGFGCGAGSDGFAVEWRSIVRRVWLQHFQSAVLHDYLARVIDAATYADVLANGRKLVAPGVIGPATEWLPIEFAAAVARFGHSMVRDHYAQWNEGNPQSIDPIGFMDFSYRFSGDFLQHQGGALPRTWVPDWYRLLDLDGLGGARQPIMAARIDTTLAAPLGSLPQCLGTDFCQGNIHAPPQFDLSTRNLRRGRDLHLVTAQQAVQQANARIGNPPIPLLAGNDLVPAHNAAIQAAFNAHPTLATATPLWYYVLREAEFFGAGSKLGPLGSRIVMETVHAAIATSIDSIFDVPGWQPSLPARQSTHFTMADLVLFTGNPDPIGAYDALLGG